MWIVWSCQMHSVWCNNLFFWDACKWKEIAHEWCHQSIPEAFPDGRFWEVTWRFKIYWTWHDLWMWVIGKKLNLFGVYTPIREGFPSSIICHKLSSPSSEVTWHKWKISHNTRTKIDSLALNWCLTPSVWLIIPRRYFNTLLVIVIYLIL